MKRPIGFVTATLTLLALAACKPLATGDAAASPSSSTSGPGSASASASPSPSGPTIPTAALLQPADLRGASMKPVDGDVGEDLRPPRPCGASHPSEAARVASIATTALLPTAGGGESVSPSVILQTIVRYRPGSAPQAFAELTAAIRRCPGEPLADKREWEIVLDLPVGEEAVLIRTSTQVRNDDGSRLTPWVWPTAVARVGDHLVLVSDLGWEASNGDEETVRTLIAAAVQRVTAAS